MARPTEWSAIGAGLSFNEAKLARGILNYRRTMRLGVQAAIRSLESQIQYQAGAMLPVRYPKRGSVNRDYLPELLEATNGRRFFVRTWCGARVVNRTRFWGHEPTNCGLDELVDATNRKGSFCDMGEPDNFESFAELVRRNRELRGRGGLCGMIANGLESWAISQLTEGPLDSLVLQGTVEEATAAVVKELRSAAVRQSPDVGERMARDYFMVQGAEEPDESYSQLLSRYDQELVGLPGVIVSSWQQLTAAQAGIVPNAEEQSEPELAPIIPLRRRLFKRFLTRTEKVAAVP